MNVVKTTEIPPSEWEVMRIVWTLKQTHADKIINQLKEKFNWSASTSKTLMRRLVKKHLLTTHRHGRRFLYRPAVSQTKMMYQAAVDLFDRMCDMHKGELLIKLVQQTPLSKGDIQTLENELVQKAKHAPENVPCNCLSKQHNC